MFSRSFSKPLRCFFLSGSGFLRRNHSVESFKFSDLKIETASLTNGKRKPDLSTTAFGKTFSDHVFQVNWIHMSGWDIPQILPLRPLICHPGSKVFHYAQSIFEGMKAFKCSDGSVNLFRPDLHIERLLSSAERAVLPLFDSGEFLECLKKLISIDKKWVPDCTSSSLYIRPTIIGTENSLAVEASSSALLYIITSPVGPYGKISPTEPASLLADHKYVRAWPGGVGDKKMACNYAPSFYVSKLAKKLELDDVLWLRGYNHQVTEAGAMNVFFFFQKGLNDFELATPLLDGTILPGVTRRSILEIARQYNEFDVTERMITMEEVVKAVEKKVLKEVFICGTAVGVCPVNKIRYLLDKDISIPTMDSMNPIFLRLHRSLTDIQYGRVESQWVVNID